MDNTITPPNDDFYGYGEDIAEQEIGFAGSGRLQLFNSDNKTRRKTSLRDGGYAIKDNNGTAPHIGPLEEIPFPARTEQMRVAKSLEVAFIGISPQFYIIKDSSNPDYKTNTTYSSVFVDVTGTKFSCRTVIDIYVAIKADAERKIWQLRAKGHITKSATVLLKEVRRLTATFNAAKSKELNRKIAAHDFALWYNLGLGEEFEAGKKPNTSMVIPPALITPPADFAEMKKCAVSKEDYLKFCDLRRELDDYLLHNKLPVIKQLTDEQAMDAAVKQIGGAIRQNGDDVETYEFAPPKPVKK